MSGYGWLGLREVPVPVLMATALMLALAGGVGADGGAEGPYYYSDGQRIALTPSRDYLAVRFYPGVTPDLESELGERVAATGERDLRPFDLELVRLRAGLSPAAIRDLVTELEHRGDIRLVAPVFESSGALMIVTDRFVAAFSPGIDARGVEALSAQHGVEVVRRLDWVPNTWVLRVAHGDALATANLFHERPEVVWAHPDFVRVFHRHPTPRQPHERMVIGPAGELLPPDTRIDKGDNRYRLVEPGEWTREPDPAVPTAPAPQAPVSRPLIKQEGFEGAFPNGWDLSGDPTWAPTTFRKYSGSKSGYCVGSSVAPPGPNPPWSTAHMSYGPFDLSDAADARVNLQAYVDSESGYDYFCIYASINGVNFYGTCWSGYWAGFVGGNGFMNILFDLKRVYTLGDVTGQPNVWISFGFVSDDIVHYEGVYLDDVVIEKITGGYDSLTSDVFDHLQWSLNNNEQLWGVAGADIRAPQAWGVTTGDSSVVIAIIDEGVDLTHPDLAAKLVPGHDATGYGGSGGPTGDDAHGTNCAGIAAALSDNSLGVAGVDWQAKIMPVRSLYGGSGYDSWLAGGITWATDNAADVLSNSWGGGLSSALINDAIAHARDNGRGGKGAALIFAAGNDNSAVGYPATLPDTLAVGALSPCDERKAPWSCDGEWWWGSNYGPELDVMAPGVHMYSTDIQGTAGYSGDDYYYNFNGTSSATPVAAGVAGLILAMDSTLTGSEVHDVIKSTAFDLGLPGRDDETGWGRADAFAAVTSFTGLPTDLYLTGVVDGTELYQACNSITAELWTVMAPLGDATLRAGNWVELGNGVAIESGCRLTVLTSPPPGCP